MTSSKPSNLPNAASEISFEYFYKYLPFDEGSLKIITDGTIKFTRPTGFNDPFDCLPCFDPSAVDNLDPGYVKHILKSKGLSPGDGILDRSRQLRKLKNEMSSGEFLRSLLEDVGILSLSKTYSNILMWSHYADCHKGFVVEFKIPASTTDPQFLANALRNKWIAPQPVTYSIIRPGIDLNPTRDREEAWTQLVKQVFTKSTVWSYELEHRALMPHRGAGIYSYERNIILNSVVGGAHIGQNGSALRQAVTELNVQQNLKVGFFQANLSKMDYSVTIPGFREYAK